MIKSFEKQINDYWVKGEYDQDTSTVICSFDYQIPDTNSFVQIKVVLETTESDIYSSVLQEIFNLDKRFSLKS